MTIGEFLLYRAYVPILLSAHNVFESNCAILGDASKNMRPTRNVLVRDVPGATIRADMGFVSIRRQRQISTTATGTRAQCHRFPKIRILLPWKIHQILLVLLPLLEEMNLPVREPWIQMASLVIGALSKTLVFA